MTKRSQILNQLPGKRGMVKKSSHATVPSVKNIERNKKWIAPVFCPEIGVKAGVELEKGAPAQVHPQVGGEGDLQSLVLQPVMPIGMISCG